jgi:GNAT superfamily N-acetyltransferase
MKKCTARPGRQRLDTLRVLPATPARWCDLATLFGKNGACGGCWCMWWRLPRAQWTRQRGAGNRQALRRLVAKSKVPGLLAYAGRQPVGWCSVGPRADFGVLGRSRVLAPVDDQPVWSVVCFFVARGFRRQGVSRRLLEAAAAFARARGARILEGYPVEPGGGAMPDLYAFTGLVSAFRQAGFIEVARRSPKRAVMRLDLTQL